MIVAAVLICIGAAVLVIGAVMSNRDTEGVEPMSWRAMERYREAEHEDETVE